MNNFFRYVDLPQVPSHLIVNSMFLEKQKNIYGVNSAHYSQFQISKDLQDFLKSIFDFEITAQYHVIRKGLSIHKDRSRTECFNYLIEDGGEDACLNIYDDSKEAILQSVRVELFKWHWINVAEFHGVSGLTDVPRLAITVTPLHKKI